LVNLLAPGIVVVGGYVLWKGSHAAGGAFQAAAVLAGGGVLLLLARRAQPPAIDAPAARTVLLAGPALYWIIAAAPVVAARPILEYPQPWAGTLIVLLESVLTLSIAWMLVLFVPLGVGTGSSSRASDRGAQ
jgi:multisubunit Na+/H+ antiporter MnhB subunit